MLAATPAGFWPRSEHMMANIGIFGVQPATFVPSRVRVRLNIADIAAAKTQLGAAPARSWLLIVGHCLNVLSRRGALVETQVGILLLVASRCDGRRMF